jgi:hypothetical protein
MLHHGKNEGIKMQLKVNLDNMPFPSSVMLCSYPRYGYIQCCTTSSMNLHTSPTLILGVRILLGY